MVPSRKNPNLVTCLFPVLLILILNACGSSIIQKQFSKNPCITNSTSRGIFNGTPASDQYFFDYVVPQYVQSNSVRRFTCTATLIDYGILLTAAHCVDFLTPSTLGRISYKSPEDAPEFSVPDRIIIHSQYIFSDSNGSVTPTPDLALVGLPYRFDNLSATPSTSNNNPSSQNSPPPLSPSGTSEPPAGPTTPMPGEPLNNSEKDKCSRVINGLSTPSASPHYPVLHKARLDVGQTIIVAGYGLNNGRAGQLNIGTVVFVGYSDVFGITQDFREGLLVLERLNSFNQSVDVGDSGGPAFLSMPDANGATIVGVTSFGEIAQHSHSGHTSISAFSSWIEQGVQILKKRP